MDQNTETPKLLKPKDSIGVNTDYDQRWSNEVDFQEKIKNLSGKKCQERLQIIRKDIFNDNGLRYKNLKNNNAQAYPTRDLVKTFLPKFFDLIDNVSPKNPLTKKSNQKDSSIRLAAIVYSLGIVLHPYRDGNGQTFRLLAQSYLRENLDQKPPFFPIKEKQNDPEFKQLSINNNLLNIFFKAMEKARPQQVKKFKADYEKSLKAVKSPFPSGDPSPKKLVNSFWRQYWNFTLQASLGGRGNDFSTKMHQEFITTGKLTNKLPKQDSTETERYQKIFLQSMIEIYKSTQENIQELVDTPQEDFETTSKRIKKETPYITDLEPLDQS